MIERKKVTLFGIVWTIISRNERVCTEGGRHFMASRCNSHSNWYLREHDCDITASANGARETGYLQYCLNTGELSLAVLDITRREAVLPARPQDDRVPLTQLVQPAPLEYLRSIGVKIELAPNGSRAYPGDIY